ncbi:hypothetical protein BT63DRAFT_421712 [Microthyrium microscopicum]|uniref:Chitin-binding type-1 domain-containing protein n=1 Tax=Microthyrium microscopicum TaxID=703497 RepID=A0A6A6URM6_9PEZI|nr:hypothetical protein BT63DRAFT_421712 [Microthyrium microscopicum]
MFIRSFILLQVLSTTILAANLKVSPNGKCGPDYPYTCRGSDNGDCCSKNDRCTDGDSQCLVSKGCQTGFGKCTDDVTQKPSKNGNCGSNRPLVTCVGSTFGSCCSKSNKCSSSSQDCLVSSGCQSKYGSCSSASSSIKVSTSLASSVLSVRPSSAASSKPVSASPSIKPSTSSGQTTLISSKISSLSSSKPLSLSSIEPTSTSSSKSSTVSSKTSSITTKANVLSSTNSTSLTPSTSTTVTSSSGLPTGTYEIKAAYPCYLTGPNTVSPPVLDPPTGDAPTQDPSTFDSEKEAYLQSCQTQCDNNLANCDGFQFFNQSVLIFPNQAPNYTYQLSCAAFTTPYNASALNCAPDASIVDAVTYVRASAANPLPSNYTAPCADSTNLVPGGSFSSGLGQWSINTYDGLYYGVLQCDESIPGDCSPAGDNFLRLNDTDPSGTIPDVFITPYPDPTTPIAGWEYKLEAWMRGVNSTWTATWPVHTHNQLVHTNTGDWQHVVAYITGGTGTLGFFCRGTSPAQCDLTGVSVLKMC